MHGYLYILRSEKSDRYYIGSTVNPQRRLSQHNANVVAATRNKGPWRQVALVEFPDKTMAGQAEKFVKRQKSRRIIENIISGSFSWPSL